MNSAGIDLSSQAVSSQVFSTRMSLTSVFGMGTGGTSLPLTPALRIYFRSECFLKSSYDPYGNRTHDYAVRGRRLSRLTKGPWSERMLVYHVLGKKSRAFAKKVEKVRKNKEPA